MSGGSWDYVSHRIQEAAQRLCESKKSERRALGKHMTLIAEAMHDIEWVDSGDSGEGKEIASIMKCITPQDVLNASIDEAKDMIARLKEIIDQIEGGKK